MADKIAAAITRAAGATLEVLVRSEHVPHIKIAGGGEYCFAYEITIANIGAVAVRLLSRHWRITDGDGNEREVRGDGVVGEQPHLEPNQSFLYVSYVDMPTPAGAMHGTYTFCLDDGEEFEVEIPCFSLAVPRAVN